MQRWQCRGPVLLGTSNGLFEGGLAEMCRGHVVLAVRRTIQILGGGAGEVRSQPRVLKRSAEKERPRCWNAHRHCTNFFRIRKHYRPPLFQVNILNFASSVIACVAARCCIVAMKRSVRGLDPKRQPTITITEKQLHTEKQLGRCTRALTIQSHKKIKIKYEVTPPPSLHSIN